MLQTQMVQSRGGRSVKCVTPRPPAHVFFVTLSTPDVTAVVIHTVAYPMEHLEYYRGRGACSPSLSDG